MGRPGEPRGHVRQGSLRLRFRQPSRPADGAAGSTGDLTGARHRSVRQEAGRAVRGGFLGRGAGRCGGQIHADLEGIRQPLHRRLRIGQVHQRGELPGAEAGPPGLGHQPRGSLRPPLPRIHRRRHAHGLRLRRDDQQHRRHRGRRSELLHHRI